MNALTDVIAAISTPPGKGGVAVIRISGEGAFEIASKIFIPLSKKPFCSYPARFQVYGHVISEGSAIDDVLAARFPAPSSYTGEDTVEICSHGGILVTKAVLEAALRAGAKPATAGEFTRRAFINGRLSLNDAEAIANILDAKSEEQLKLGSDAARSKLKLGIDEIKGEITSIMSSIYARIDYPDEDLGDFSDDEVLTRLEKAESALSSLISTYKTGRAITEGISAVLCGKPNVGKSSVYNAILDKDAAIVTSLAGTTRDVLEETIPLGRVLLRLCDTAGIRGGKEIDEVEAIGIRKSREHMMAAELIIAVFDLTSPVEREDLEIIEEIKSLKGAKIALLNKSDAASDNIFDKSKLYDCFDEILTVTACEPEALKAKLTDTVNKLFTDEKISAGNDAIVSSARLYGMLSAACDYIRAAKLGLSRGFSQDAVSSDIERALAAISESDGRGVSEDVVQDIFSKFCVGK